MTKPRLCACGCERPVNPDARGAKYSSLCAVERSLAQRREWKRRKMERMKLERASQSAAPQQERRVAAQWETVKVRHQKCCKACSGMPWARQLDRLDEYERPIGKLDSKNRVVCRECGEPYGEERPPERPNVLGSSSGTAARHGQLHGTFGK